MKYDYTLAFPYFHIATVRSILSLLPKAAMATFAILRKNWKLTFLHSRVIVHLLPLSLAADVWNNLQ